MKKFESLGRSLSKGEQKNIMGGPNEEGGQCCGCDGGPGLYSCWYTSGSCAAVCAAVYPNHQNSNMGSVGCMGCTMN